MKNQEIEKQIRELEGKNTQLRIKNADLKSENAKLFDEQILFKKAIADLTAMKGAVLDEIKQAKISLSEVQKKASDMDSNIKNTLCEVNKKTELQNEYELSLTRREEALADKVKANNDLSLRLKSDRQTVIQKLAQLDGLEAKLLKEKEELKKQVDIITKDREELIIKASNVDVLREQALKNIEKSKEILDKAVQKKTLYDNSMATIKQKEEEIVRVNAEIEVAIKDLAKRQKAIDLDFKTLQAKRTAFEKEIAIKEQELEIKRLRVEKLIRDKNVKSELEQLEKELSDK